LPSSQQSYASDRIRAGTLDCQNAIGSSTNVEFGVVGFINSGNEMANPYETDMTTSQSRVGDIGVYAKINIPIGGPKERINCNTLYKLELELKRMEVMKLKAEIDNLKQLQFAKED
jgi:hypothetical protein|tara:strand:+ start:781 stop:1128 length:348 start_codon:yes stop_codon:yes gene_type:complete